MNAVPMMRGGSQASWSSASRSSPWSRDHAVAHVAEGVGIDLAEGVQVVGQMERSLAHGLEGDDAQPVPAALLAKEPEVLFPVGRDLAQHGHPPVAVAGQPGCTSAASAPQSPFPSRKLYSPPNCSVPAQLIRGTCNWLAKGATTMALSEL